MRRQTQAKKAKNSKATRMWNGSWRFKIATKKLLVSKIERSKTLMKNVMMLNRIKQFLKEAA